MPSKVRKEGFIIESAIGLLGARQLKIVVPFSVDFVREIKELIPSDRRAWNSEQKAWLVYVPYLAVGRQIAKRHYSIEELVLSTDRDGNDYKRGYEDGLKKGIEVGQARKASHPDLFQQGYIAGLAAGRRSYSSPGADEKLKGWYTSGSSDHTTLGVLPNASPELIRAAYRVASLSAHPDRGGSNQAMVELNAAYERLMKRYA